MAKNNAMNIVQQHIEKGVLALSVLLLIYAVFHWGLSSPREIGPENKPPGEVDSWLAQRAESVDRRYSDERYTPPPVPEYKRAYLALLNQKDSLPAMVDWVMPGQPTTLPGGEAKPVLELKKLADAVPSPSKPSVGAVRALYRPDAESKNELDLNVATGVFGYPYTELWEKWRQELASAGLFKLVMARVEVEVQEQLPDGSWSAPHPAKIKPQPLKDSDGRPTSMPVLPELAANNSNLGDVRQTIDALVEVQQYALEPEFGEVWWSGGQKNGWVTWRTCLPWWEGFGEKQVPATTGGLNVMPGGPGAVPGPIDPVMMPGPIAPPPPPARSGGRVVGPPGDLMPPDPMLPGPGPAVGRQPVVRPTPTPRPTVVPAVVVTADPMMWEVPAMSQQLVDTKKIAGWFCDTSLASGKTYRFRIRLCLVNPLYSYPNLVKEPADARTPYIFSPWSEWSDEVSVPESSEFFVIGMQKDKGTVTVALFSRCRGQVVEASSPMKVVPGEVIGKKEKKSVLSPEGQKVEAEVNFEPGVVVLGIAFPKGSGSDAELTYVDSNGVIRTKLYSLDYNSPLYKELKKKADDAAAAVKAAGNVPIPPK